MSTINASPSSPSGLEAKVEDALSGVQSVLPAKSTLQLNNAAMTQAQLSAQLNGYLTTAAAVETAKQSYAEAVAARKTAEPLMREFLVQLRAALVALFGRGSLQLAKFGMTASKPSKQSPTTAVLAAAQRQLTRAQRGTMSKKQRTSITLVTPPQVTMGGAGELSVLPPTVNPAPGSASSTAAAQSSEQAGEAPSAAAQVAPAVATPVAPLASK